METEPLAAGFIAKRKDFGYFQEVARKPFLGLAE
jgi:hypothetical protein